MTADPASAVARHAPAARQFLKDMIRFPSISGEEREILDFCLARFRETGAECEIAPIDDDIRLDPEYSHPETPVLYEGRGNLVVNRRGSGGGRSLILQSHVDVVPADDWPEAFDPTEDGDLITGRGAADAKGQVAAIWLALMALQTLRAQHRGEVQAQIVLEEEFGGNGALALIRQGHTADAAVILESSRLDIHPANRGAIWFRIRVQGLPCHMGRKHEGISAIDLSYKIIQALYGYEQQIIEDSAGYPGFERYPRPVQVNVGLLHSGTWPSTVAAEAVIEGGVGFLPNRSMDQVKREVLETIRSIDDPWLQEHFTLEFPRLHNDSYETDYSHPAVRALQQACSNSGHSAEVYGWNVSCDARLYSRVGGMPAIVFGPGDVTQAHSRGESIDFSEVVKAAEVLVRLVIDWCG